MDGPLASAYEAASGFFVEAVQSVPDNDWEKVGLGDWTFRELVAHGNRAHLLVEEYLLRPQPQEPPGSDYFTEAAIGERARQSVVVLGDDPKAAVAGASRKMIALVQQKPAQATIGSPVAGTLPLAEYLPSRIAELTIHGLDITRAVGSDIAVPSPALHESVRFLAAQAVKRRQGEVVLLALSGRGQLPPGFSLY